MMTKTTTYSLRLSLALVLRAIVVLAVSALVFAAMTFVLPQKAWADLEVKVGYTSSDEGYFYTKYTFTEEEFERLSSSKIYKYSYFDRGSFLRKGYGRGMTLEEIFDHAGIDASSIKRFYFATADMYVDPDNLDGEGLLSWYYSELCGNRYYFDDMAKFFDFETRSLVQEEGTDVVNELWKSAEKVPSIIAYQSSFARIEKESEWDETPTLTRSAGLRLFFGQSSPETGDAGYSAQEVNTIYCIFDGTPELSFEISKDTPVVGDTVKVTPHLSGGDSLIEQKGVSKIEWAISDTSVADFVVDENGQIVRDADGSVWFYVYKAGNFDITATYGKSEYGYVSSASLGSSADAEKEDQGGGGEQGGGGGKQGGGDSGGETGGGGSGDATREVESALANGATGQSLTLESSAAASASLSGSDLSSGKKTLASGQAWKLNITTTQDSLDLPVAEPFTLFVYGCFVVGVIWRVRKCQRDKDPFMDLPPS